MSTAPPPRFEISRAEIERVVARFYAGVRGHAVLGPVFARHVDDWPEHEAKIARFWASAILHERSYAGNPMRAHREAGNVRAGMFTPWLALFDEVLQSELTPLQARAWSELAHRMGQGLRAGVVDTMTLPGGVPKLV